MMENVFLHLLNMSLTAAVLVVVVLLLRLVFHKAPRWIHCLLWALVAVRLLCPFAIESDLSLMPSTPVVTVPDSLTLSDPVVTPNAPTVDVIYPDAPATPVPPQTNVGGTVTTPVTPTLPDSSVAAPGDSVDPWQVALTVATYVWLLGVLAMLIYAVATTLRLRLQVREAVCVRGNLWQCDHLRSPFILGVLRPRIYLPSDLSSTAQASVIAHEKAHLKRLDHLWKPLGFLLLTVYWFNPVLWVAYIFLCRDIEAACDEQVVRNMTAADRKAYSEALLACSAPRRLVSACPLAFGETSVKSRIKSVLSYKKPTIWIVVAALLVSTVAGVCLLTDRPVAEQEPDVTDKSTYAVFVHSDRPMAQIRLEMGGTHCTYTPSTLSSAMPAEGTYVTEEDRITLTFADPDMILVFKGDFTGLTFCDEDSRYQEEYLTFGGYTLPDGAVFVRRTDNSVSDKDDTLDTAKTAPVGLTHVAGGLGEWQNETLQAVYGTPPEGSLPIKAFASYDELDAFLSTYATAEGKIQRADFTAFDADWFADNTLLMSYYTHPTTPAYPKVDSYVYSEDGAGLTVRLHVYVPSFGGDAFSANHLFSGIRKSDLEGVKVLTAVVAATIPNDYYVAAFAEHTEHPEKAVEKWRRWLPSDEAWALERMLSEWDDAARWGDAQSVDRALTFATAINLHGHTHYLATDYSALLRDDGALLWLDEAEGAFLHWIAAYYDETNEDLLYMAYSHPTYYDRRYAAPPMVLTSPELKAVLNSNRWETAFGDVSTYGRFTLGGTVYHIDRTRERIVYANDDNTALYAVYLTAEELAFVDGILASTPWAHTDYMVGKVTQIFADEDCVMMKLTDSSKYTSDISDGDEVRVSLRYYVGETPAVGSTIRVTYDGYLNTYYDDDHYGPYIHASSVTVTSQPTGTTTTKPTTTKPTPTTKPTTKKPTTTTATVPTTTTTTAPTTPAVKTAAVGESHVAGGYGLWKDEIVNEVYGERPEGSELRVRVIRSYAELDAILDERAVNDRYLKHADFYRFDAAWFEENALIMTYFIYGGCPVEPTVASYVYSEDGTTLTVGLDVYLPGMLDDAMGCWHLFSGIKKSDLEGVTKVTAYVRAEIPKHNYVAVFTEPTRNPQSAVEEWRTWTPYSEGRHFSQLITGGLFKDGNRACKYVAVINQGGHNYYIAEDFAAIQRDDGKLYWMTEYDAESIRKLIAAAEENYRIRDEY